MNQEDTPNQIFHMLFDAQLHFPPQKSLYAPFFCLWEMPVSDRDRMCPLELRPIFFWASDKEQRRAGGGAKAMGVEPFASGCSLLWVELFLFMESRCLRFPRLPIARYSGPSSRSASGQSRISAAAGEVGSVKAMWGIPVSGGLWFRPHTHGAPCVLLDGNESEDKHKCNANMRNGHNSSPPPTFHLQISGQTTCRFLFVWGLYLCEQASV